MSESFFPSYPRLFYIVFRDSIKRNWWDVFTQPGFRHCAVMEEVQIPYPSLFSSTGTVFTDVVRGEAVIEVFCKPAHELIFDRMKRRKVSIAISFVVDKKSTLRYIPFGMLSCVGIVKSLLGVRKWWILTPYQLFKYLEKRGGEPLCLR